MTRNPPQYTAASLAALLAEQPTKHRLTVTGGEAPAKSIAETKLHCACACGGIRTITWRAFSNGKDLACRTCIEGRNDDRRAEKRGPDVGTRAARQMYDDLPSDAQARVDADLKARRLACLRNGMTLAPADKARNFIEAVQMEHLGVRQDEEAEGGCDMRDEPFRQYPTYVSPRGEAA